MIFITDTNIGKSQTMKRSSTSTDNKYIEKMRGKMSRTTYECFKVDVNTYTSRNHTPICTGKWFEENFRCNDLATTNELCDRHVQLEKVMARRCNLFELNELRAHARCRYLFTFNRKFDDELDDDDYKDFKAWWIVPKPYLPPIGNLCRSLELLNGHPCKSEKFKQSYHCQRHIDIRKELCKNYHFKEWYTLDYSISWETHGYVEYYMRLEWLALLQMKLDGIHVKHIPQLLMSMGFNKYGQWILKAKVNGYTRQHFTDKFMWYRDFPW